jgi:hypothetical protein
MRPATRWRARGHIETDEAYVGGRRRLEADDS